MPFKALLTHLICTGDDEPQVTAYGPEEEVDYYAPAFRFEDEDDNPWIPYRQMSETPYQKIIYWMRGYVKKRRCN